VHLPFIWHLRAESAYTNRNTVSSSYA